MDRLFAAMGAVCLSLVVVAGGWLLVWYADLLFAEHVAQVATFWWAKYLIVMIIGGASWECIVRIWMNRTDDRFYIRST